MFHGGGEGVAKQNQHKTETLRGTIYFKGPAPQSIQGLPDFGIQVVSSLQAIRQVHEIDNGQVVDVCLLGLDALKPVDRKSFVARCQETDIGVVLCGSIPFSQIRDYVREGAASLIPAMASAAEIACALWSAHWQTVANGELRKELHLLRSEIEDQRRVERAVSLISCELGCTQEDARRRLRREARNRRQKVLDIAAIIQAHEIRSSFRS